MRNRFWPPLTQAEKPGMLEQLSRSTGCDDHDVRYKQAAILNWKHQVDVFTRLLREGYEQR